MLRTGGRVGHVTPERVLRSNLRLLLVNLLKTKQLRENPSDPGLKGGQEYFLEDAGTWC